MTDPHVVYKSTQIGLAPSRGGSKETTLESCLSLHWELDPFTGQCFTYIAIQSIVLRRVGGQNSRYENLQTSAWTASGKVSLNNLVKKFVTLFKSNSWRYNSFLNLMFLREDKAEDDPQDN